jgi:hypothetical protein
MPDAGASRKRQIQGRCISGESRVMPRLPSKKSRKTGMDLSSRILGWAALSRAVPGDVGFI